MQNIQISPSLICADLSRMGEQVKILTESGADLFHWDIMDGVYTHNFCLTPGMMKACRPYSKLPFEAHLCISDPASFINELADSGADIITLQYETTPHIHRALDHIHERKIKAGVVINPSTPIDHMESFLEQVQMVTVMTVDAGLIGQKFISSMVDKIRHMREWIEKRGLEIDIQVDGQINTETIPRVINAGANVLVLGRSGLFTLNPDISTAIKIVKKQIEAVIKTAD